MCCQAVDVPIQNTEYEICVNTKYKNLCDCEWVQINWEYSIEEITWIFDCIDKQIKYKMNLAKFEIVYKINKRFQSSVLFFFAFYIKCSKTI